MATATATATDSVRVPEDCKTLKEASDRVNRDDCLATIVLGQGEHHIDGRYMFVSSAMSIVGDPAVAKEEIVVVGGGIYFKKGIPGNYHLQHLTLRQSKGAGVVGESSFTMEDVLVEQCVEDGVVANGRRVVGSCTNVEVRLCGGSGVVAKCAASITLIGAKTKVHHNCTNGKRWCYGLQVCYSSFSSSSTIHLVAPLTKEQASTDNGGGGNWGYEAAYGGTPVARPWDGSSKSPPSICLAKRHTAFATHPFFAGSSFLKLFKASPLPGGQQNQNFLVALRRGPMPVDSDGFEIYDGGYKYDSGDYDKVWYVVRVPGIDASEHGQTQETVYTNSVAANEILKVAPVPRGFDPSTGITVTRYVGMIRSWLPTYTSSAQPLTLDMLHHDPRLLDEVVRTIRMFHDRSDENTLISSKASDVVDGYSLVELLEGWEGKDDGVLVEALQLQTLLRNTLARFDPLVACHNDLCFGNILIRNKDREEDHIKGGGSIYYPQDSTNVTIIDWEWAGPGDRLCDLGIFCSFCSLTEQEEHAVLRTYLDRVPSALELARMGLWKCWFALRGALWARQKATSEHFRQDEINEDNNYELFAKNDYAQFKQMLTSDRVQQYISVVQDAM